MQDRSVRGLLGDQDLDQRLRIRRALPSAFEKTLDAYRALEALVADGEVRAIGVSNFRVDTSPGCSKMTDVPVVNQVECHLHLPSEKSRTSAPNTALSRRPVTDRWYHLLP
jgi:diketogulonate reductase-like aldo/keto reductase